MYLIMDDVLANVLTYRVIYQDILDLMKWGFEIKEVREKPIRFKFHKEDKKYHKLQMRHFLSNMILWYAFAVTDSADIMDESFIHNFVGTGNKEIMEYINNKILPNVDADLYTQNKIVDEIVYNMNAIAAAFAPIMGLGISVYSIIQMEKNNPEISNLIFGSIDPTLQPKQIEEELDRRTERLIQLFSEIDNDLKPLFVSGKNLSHGQFKEIAVKIGLKSDINGIVIPHMLDCNILVDGINKPSFFYIVAQSGRKSLILTKTKMGVPGAFSKKMNTNTTAAVLRKDYEMCNSIRPVMYHVNDDKFLKLLDKRYYYDDRGEMRCIDYEHNKDLIGKDIPVRSPCTCTSEEGICRFCYGDLYEINKDLFSAGAYAATKETNPIGQSILSSKHLQATHSNSVMFPAQFDDMFELTINEVSLRDDIEIGDEKFYLYLNNIQVEETEESEVYFVTEFSIINADGEVKYNISEDNQAKLYLSNQLTALCRKTKDRTLTFDLDNLDDDSSVLFFVEVKNKELTKPAQNIEKLLNTKDKLGCKTIDELCQKIAEQKIDAGFNFELVHDEMMIRELIRKASNEYERPDFSANGDISDYTILRLNSALFKNPSPIVSLSYGYLRKQLLSPELYHKHEDSHLDPLFVVNLSSVLPDKT